MRVSQEARSTVAGEEEEEEEEEEEKDELEPVSAGCAAATSTATACNWKCAEEKSARRLPVQMETYELKLEMSLSRVSTVEAWRSKMERQSRIWNPKQKPGCATRRADWWQLARRTECWPTVVGELSLSPCLHHVQRLGGANLPYSHEVTPTGREVLPTNAQEGNPASEEREKNANATAHRVASL